MRTCLTDEELELLLRDRAPWLRGLFWRRHQRRCPRCQARLEQLRADERLLQKLRQALPGPAASPLSAARSKSGPGRSGGQSAAAG